MPFEELNEAIQEETQRFEKFYLWLEKSMPKIFFTEVSKEEISLIVHSLVGFAEQNYFAQIHLKKGAIAICLDSPDADVRILQNYPLHGIKNYTTYISKEPHPFPHFPGLLRIAILDFTEAFEKAEEPLTVDAAQALAGMLATHHPDWPPEKSVALVQEMDARFIRKMTPDRQLLSLEMLEKAKERDHCQYEVQYEADWEEKGSSSMFMVLAWRNTPKHNFLYRLARVIRQHGLVMRRVNAAYLNPYQVDSILMLSFELHGAKGAAAWDTTDIADFLQEMVTVKYFGSLDLIDATFVQPGILRGNMGNLA